MMKNLKLRVLVITSMVCCLTWGYAQQCEEQPTLTELSENDVDISLWDLIEEGAVVKRYSNSNYKIVEPQNQVFLQDTIQVQNEKIIEGQVPHYRHRALLGLKYKNVPSEAKLVEDLDLLAFSLYHEHSGQECPRAYSKTYLIPSQIIRTGSVNDEFPSYLFFDPIFWKHETKHSLIYNYGNKISINGPFADEQHVLGSFVAFFEYFCTPIQKFAR